MINGQPRRIPLKDTTNYRPGLPPPPSPCGSCTKPPIPTSPPYWFVCSMWAPTCSWARPRWVTPSSWHNSPTRSAQGSPCGATLFAKALFSILLWRTTTATYKVDSIGCLGQTVPRVCLRRRRQAPGRGLTEQLEKFLREHLDIELIVIDIFQKIQEAEGAQYSYFGNYEVMAQLEAFADCHSVCLLLIHHTRKQQKISSI